MKINDNSIYLIWSRFRNNYYWSCLAVFCNGIRNNSQIQEQMNFILRLNVIDEEIATYVFKIPVKLKTVNEQNKHRQ